MSVSREDKRTDVAALAAGVVAVSVSMLVAPGPYDLLGAIVALTMALIIRGYVWPNPRGTNESVALGALSGIVLIPIACYGWEMVVTLSKGELFDRRGNPETWVPDWFPATVWVVGFLIFARWDYRRWNRPAKGNGTKIKRLPK